MAVTVTKMGTRPTERVFAGKCRDCKTEIECLARDTMVHSDQRDGDMRTVQCPTCSTLIYVWEKNPDVGSNQWDR